MFKQHLHHALCVVAAMACCIAGTASHADEPVFLRGAVAADHEVASQAGLQMLQRGGNAVDAAVATSFCLSVVRPFSCGIGGGGFMIIYDPTSARSTALNYRETCPAAVGPDFYADLDDPSASRFGFKASGVPGSVAGLCHALRVFGTLDLPTVLAPAIRAAEEGFAADAAFVNAVQSIARTTRDRPDLRTSLGVIWSNLCRDGDVQVGDVIRNPDQAHALRLIAQHGEAAFYSGEIAHAIDQLMRANHGTITIEDLRAYTVKAIEPMRGRFRGREVLSMPPPSSGGMAMQQVVGMLERKFDIVNNAAHNSVDYVHVVAESFKHAFADRARWLADPAFVRVPVHALLDGSYLDSRAAAIDMKHTIASEAYGVADLPEDGGTSHFSVIDSTGMAVACTETINLEFGSLVCVPGFGFCLNNQMDDFTTQRGAANAFGLRQSDANLPQPGKRPLSSMSPTIVLRDDKAIIIIGGSGGPRIITATLQCMLNAMLFNMTPEPAVNAPRFHHQWMPDRLLFDRLWKDSQAVIHGLQMRGHQTAELTSEAVVQMIAVDEQGNIRAASDPRKGGKPAGW